MENEFGAFQLQQPFNQENVNRVVEARVEHIWRSNNQNGLVTISYDDRVNRRFNELVTLIVSPITVIQSTSGQRVNLNDLRIGMRVNAIFSNRMTRSIPPQAVAFLIVVLDRRERAKVTEGRVLDVNLRNRSLEIREHDRGRRLEEEKRFRDRDRDRDRNRDRNRITFQITNSTRIENQRGRRIDLSDLRRDDSVRVQFRTERESRRPDRNIAIFIQVL